MKRIHDMVEHNYEKLLHIGISLSAQRNMSMLFDTIITEAMSITNCDGGTLYIYEGDLLHFKIMRNNTMKTYKGGQDEAVELPPVPISEQNVCTYVVIHREMENIEDVYNSNKFDFSGPKKYDQITGYRTKSMLVIPLENNKGEVVAVLQLINALDENNKVIPFDQGFEKIFRSVASQAAIAVTNMKYTKEIKNLFNSLVQVLAAAIDERTPFNANHTKNVSSLVAGFIDFLNEKYRQGLYHTYFAEEMKEQIVMAAWLHDVGKIITPLEIMGKATRLGSSADLLAMRFDKIYLCERIKFLEGLLSQEEWDSLSKELIAAKALCLRMDREPVLEDEDIAQIATMRSRETVADNGERIEWITERDAENLSVKYGTLTSSERDIMENHVVITERLLSKIEFTSEYKDVPIFAVSHHERLNGKGYPKALKADQMPVAIRMLGVMDVFEALTAEDRPYKRSMTHAEAIEILERMAADGELDTELVMLLKQQYTA